MSVVCLNGKFLPGDEPVLLASNRSYRYGDGLFETIKMKDGKLLLADYHFDRLYKSLNQLKYEMSSLFLRQRIENEITTLCKRNTCEKLARVRLSVFRGNGGLYDGDRALQYLIECWPLDEGATIYNENGLVTDIFPDAQKSCDKFCNLKTANCLPYTMAAVYAKENKLNDCIVLNTSKQVADTTIANIFVIKNNNIITPPLSEGCIAGVMRRYLLECLPKAGYVCEEKSLSVNELEEADEIFLTNAIKGIRWVRSFQSKQYSNSLSLELYNKFINNSQFDLL